MESAQLPPGAHSVTAFAFMASLRSMNALEYASHYHAVVDAGDLVGIHDAGEVSTLLRALVDVGGYGGVLCCDLPVGVDDASVVVTTTPRLGGRRGCRHDESGCACEIRIKGGACARQCKADMFSDQDIIDADVAAHAKSRPRTGAVYAQSLRGLVRKTGAPSLQHTLLDIDRSRSAIEATHAAVNGRLSNVTAAVEALKAAPVSMRGRSTALERWRELQREYGEQKRILGEENRVSPEDLANMVPLELIATVAAGLTHETYVQSRDKVILTIAAHVFAKRAEWGTLRLVGERLARWREWDGCYSEQHALGPRGLQNRQDVWAVRGDNACHRGQRNPRQPQKVPARVPHPAGARGEAGGQQRLFGPTSQSVQTVHGQAHQRGPPEAHVGHSESGLQHNDNFADQRDCQEDAAQPYRAAQIQTPLTCHSSS
jgi:hypothetical protein